MAGRPTITDVAQAAGVSVATVDRVLNGRERVREDTARRVYEAARGIGYHAAPLIGQRVQADMPRLRLGFVLHKEKQAFYQAFRERARSGGRRGAGHPRGGRRSSSRRRRSPADFAGADRRHAREDVPMPSRRRAVTHPEVTDAVVQREGGGRAVLCAAERFRPGRAAELRGAQQPEDRAGSRRT